MLHTFVRARVKGGLVQEVLQPAGLSQIEPKTGDSGAGMQRPQLAGACADYETDISEKRTGYASYA